MTIAATRTRGPRAVFAYAANVVLPITSVQVPSYSTSPFTSPFVEAGTLQLPRVPDRSASILTLAAAQAALPAPTSVSSATLAAAHSLVRTVSKPIRLDPRTGELVAHLPTVTACAIASDANLAAFPSFATAQSALRRGAHLGGAVLSPHVIVPVVGQRTYIYFLASHTNLFARLLAHLRLIYEDLDLYKAPLPRTASALEFYAAAGVACRLRREAHRLLDRRTPISVPLPSAKLWPLRFKITLVPSTQIRSAALLHPDPLLLQLALFPPAR